MYQTVSLGFDGNIIKIMSTGFMDSIFIKWKYQTSWALRFLHYKMCLFYKYLSDDQMKSCD